MRWCGANTMVLCCRRTGSCVVVESCAAGPTSALSICRSGRKGRQRSIIWQGEGSIPEDADTAPSSSLPSTEDVIRKTEQITKNIQELLRAAQENKHDR